VLILADQGHQRALADHPYLRAGLNVCQGKITCREVAAALHYPYHDPLHVLAT
jgi:alanine dehydrogenase